MLRCTHPHFYRCELVNVYAGGSAMACVGAASTARLREVLNSGDSGAGGGSLGSGEASVAPPKADRQMIMMTFR
jgi:hypothetical protein